MADPFAHVLVESHLTKFRVLPSDEAATQAIEQQPYLRDQVERLHKLEDAQALAQLIEEQIGAQTS